MQPSRRRGVRLRVAPLLLAIAAAFVGGPMSAADPPPVFRHPFDGAPLDVKPQPGEVETDAVRRFKTDGRNGYRDDTAAIAAGKALYDEHCQLCHGAGATGKMGPRLIGTDHVYAQTATDVGMFAIIYGGAGGAMQPFSRRGMSQDDMLKIIAYLRSLER